MKDADVANMLAVLGDAESRSTAMLVEIIAATTLFKVAPPEGDAVAEVEIGQGDIADAMAGFFYAATYDDSGVMRLRLSRSQDSLTLAQEKGQAEVTSKN